MGTSGEGTTGWLLVREQAGPRVRVVDEAMFTIERPGLRPATCRAQVFTAPGLRSVVVATQTMSEGSSLENTAEAFAGQAWSRLLPDEVEPPMWIEHQHLHQKRYLRLVRFENSEQYVLSGPQWRGFSHEELQALVAGPVDLERGPFAPMPEEPEDVARYVVTAVVGLPRPQPFREPGCMPAGTPWLRRLFRQFFPHRGRLGCCWYHGGDWHQVTAAAIRLVRRAQATTSDSDVIYDAVMNQAKAEHMEGWALAALDSLVMAGGGIQVERDDDGRRWYVNGQHRAQALLDAGVRRTITIACQQPTGPRA